jgi:hypothetical protein
MLRFSIEMPGLQIAIQQYINSLPDQAPPDLNVHTHHR